MKEVTLYEFITTICNDYNIESVKKIKTYKHQFPIKNGKISISSRYNAIIVDNDGNEHPYMINSFTRNNEKLIDFDYIYVIMYKSISDIIEETGVNIKTSKAKICEGGGWYSQGTRYTYKDIYCEI